MKRVIFDEGEAVICGAGYGKALPGATAVVTTACYDSDQFVRIRWDRNGLDNGQDDGGYYPKDFKSLSPVKEADTSELDALKAIVPHFEAVTDEAARERMFTYLHSRF